MLKREDQQALKILSDTVKNEGNRYSVGLLWKDEKPLLHNNRDLAVARLKSLEKKLAKNETTAEMYRNTMNEYISKGHATKLTKEQINVTSSITNYIPHHGVIEPNKPGKIRVVFDGSSKYKNTSLNEKLLKGPDLLNNLFAVLLRFRKNEFAVMSDIEKMFHQVGVKRSDRDSLRFLWRDSPKLPINDYVMNVHLFGKTDLPCCANWV